MQAVEILEDYVMNVAGVLNACTLYVINILSAVFGFSEGLLASEPAVYALMLCSYIASCVLVANFGRRTLIGFKGFFYFSFILTPIVGAVVLIITSPIRSSNTVK